MTESGVAQAVRHLEKEHEGLTLGYRAHFPEIEVKVHVRADTASEAEERAESIATEVRTILGDAVFGGKEDSFAAVVGAALRDQGKTLAELEPIPQKVEIRLEDQGRDGSHQALVTIQLDGGTGTEAVEDGATIPLANTKPSDS